MAEDLFAPPLSGVEGSGVERSQVDVPWQEGLGYPSSPAELSRLQGRAFISPLHISLASRTHTVAESVGSQFRAWVPSVCSSPGTLRG